MNMRLVKPEIAKRAGEEGKIYSFGKEIWRFILVFLIGSFIAGLIPAIYEMYLFLSDMEMFDQLQRLFLNGDSSFSDMMELATNMTDGMYILTLFCTLILIISVLVYCNKIEKRSYYSMGLVKKDGAKHYVQGLLVGAVSFSLCVLAGFAKKLNPGYDDVYICFPGVSEDNQKRVKQICNFIFDLGLDL